MGDDFQPLGEDELRAIFQTWDANSDGYLSLAELQEGLRKLRLPSSPADIVHYGQRFRAMDKDKDGQLSESEFLKLSFRDFVDLVREKETGLRAVFNGMDTDGSGFLDMSELKNALDSLNMPYDEVAIKRLFSRLDANGDGLVSFSEFRDVLLHVPEFNTAAVIQYWERAALLNLDDDAVQPSPVEVESGGKNVALINSVAGACASILAKTSTAPIERLKIIFQQYQTKPPSMIQTLRNIYKGEGVRGLFRGNLVNLMKSSPESAVKFAVFERAQEFLMSRAKNSGQVKDSLAPGETFLCGAAGGVAAHSSCFPLEVLKTKMAGSAQGTYSSLLDCVRKTYVNEGGVAAFYRGLTPVVLSTIPHAGTSLASYQISRDKLADLAGGEHPPAWVLLSAATISTVCGTTVATPLHVIKTRVIMRQAPDGAIALIGSIWKNEGASGFMRGFAPSMIKGIPAHIVSYSVYEAFRRYFGVSKKHKKHGH